MAKRFKRKMGTVSIGDRFNYTLWFKIDEFNNWRTSSIERRISFEFNMDDGVFDGYRKDFGTTKILDKDYHNCLMGGFHGKNFYEKVWIEFENIDEAIQYFNYLSANKSVGIATYNIDKNLDNIINEYKIMIL
jgi:hypothetical protein